MTNKVVINICYGGFSLSREAVLRAREISGDPKWGAPKDGKSWTDRPKDKWMRK